MQATEVFPRAILVDGSHRVPTQPAGREGHANPPEYASCSDDEYEKSVCAANIIKEHLLESDVGVRVETESFWRVFHRQLPRVILQLLQRSLARCVVCARFTETQDRKRETLLTTVDEVNR